MSCTLMVSVVSTAQAEEPSRLEKASTEARRETEKALKAAKEKQRQASAQLRQAEIKLKRATAETKKAAEDAVAAAKGAYESAEQAVLQAEQQVKLGVTKLHEAKGEAEAKVGELKSQAETAVAEVKAEAEATQEKAARTVHVMQAKAHELVRGAVGGTSENARRQAARRLAWRELASSVERPENVPPSVREELRRNAQRVARLRRIRALATERKETALIARAETLLARESIRHDKQLAALWTAARTKQSASERLKAAAPDDELEPLEEAAEEEEEQP